MARQVLGKGLSALIQQNEVSASLTQQMNDEKRVITAKVSEIRLSPFQPRRIFKEEQIRELAKSIQERGLVQPLACGANSRSQGSESCGDEGHRSGSGGDIAH